MPKKKRQIYETPRILSDLPLELRDRAHFHFDDFAATLARLIADKETRTPLTIGVSGAWGAGKTTLLRRLQKQLDQTQVLLDPAKPAVLDFCNPDENPQKMFRVCRTVWFNAWKYADEEQLLVALVRVIVQAMSGDDIVSKAMGKLLDPSYPRRDVVNTVLSWFSIKVGEVGVGLNTGEPKATPFAEKTAMLDLFNEAFDRLMAAWVHRKLDADKIDPRQGVLVVFIDDLDRCLPARMVQVLEAVKLFLDKPGCVFVLGAETGIVQRAVAKHYEDAGVTGESARDYLEKVIQLNFALPPVGNTEMQDYLNLEGVDAEVQKHWQLLVTGAEFNPRKVKTFSNDLELQWKMLVNAGQARGVDRDDFTRWQVLMRAAPDNFKKRIFDIDDLGLRLKFVQDALRWSTGQGDDILNKTFQEYETSLRLRRVLRELKAFSDKFDAANLDAFVHLSAPPQKPGTLAETALVQEVVSELEALEESPAIAFQDESARQKAARLEALRGIQQGVPARDENRLLIGGLEFVRIPAGRFLMGSKDDNPLANDDEKPQHSLELPEYWIGKYPVTNEQYAACLGDKEHPVDDWQQKKDHPVVNVSWQAAVSFCRWFNETYLQDLSASGLSLRLPSEAEWEKAARGEFGNEWPWGNEFDSAKCNAAESGKGGTTPVGAYPQGASPYGVLDMAGNVWEWTHSLYEPYPYDASDGREDENGDDPRILRGGAFSYSGWNVRCASRRSGDPGSEWGRFGFRVGFFATSLA